MRIEIEFGKRRGGKTFMTYQMTVTLTDQEYQVLAAEAARRGEPPERLCCKNAGAMVNSASIQE